MNQRACPACTLLTDDLSRTTCELCGCELDGPAAKPLGEKALVEEAPPKRRRSIESFFKRANAPTPAAPPTAPTPAPSAPDPSPTLGATGAPLLAAAEPPPPAATATASTAAAPTVAVAAASTATSAASAVAAPPALPLTDVSALTLPLAQYAPQRACWRRPGAAVPYAHLAAALDALEATSSRLAKECVLSNTFRSVLALRAPPSELEAACYLLSPAKDAQTGGHRLRPDWQPGGKPLGITHGAITAAILEATGARPQQYRVQ